MRNKWVVDASPLILLAKAGHINLLTSLSDQLIIPEAVAQEIQQGPAHDPARQWLRAGWASFVLPESDLLQVIASWDLGPGETSVICTTVQNPGWEAIIDDRAARKCALVHRISFRGTLGVILAARKHSLIPAAKPVCKTLLQAGLLIDQEVLRQALELVGE